MADFNWDGESYTEGGEGGDFISEDAFLKLIYTDAVVLLTGIREGTSPGFDNKGPQPQWLVDFVTAKGEEFTKGWSKTNEERNDRMQRLQATLEAADGDPIEVSFGKVGRRYDIVKPKGTFGA